MILLHDWFEWSNAGIGVGGFLLTIGALWQAKSAKEAAESAEKSVQGHHAETDFSILARMARELHGYVEHGQLREAKVRMTDLRSELSSSLQRHKQFLHKSWKLLMEQQYALTNAAHRLNHQSEELSPDERIRLLESIGVILEVLAGQCGELGSIVERSASHE